MSSAERTMRRQAQRDRLKGRIKGLNLRDNKGNTVRKGHLLNWLLRTGEKLTFTRPRGQDR